MYLWQDGDIWFFSLKQPYLKWIWGGVVVGVSVDLYGSGSVGKNPPIILSLTDSAGGGGCMTI